MLDSLLELDSQLLLWINGNGNPYWDDVMFMLSKRVIWFPLYVTMLYAVYLCYGWRTMVTSFVMAFIAVGLADQICANVIRPFVGRLRPCDPDNPLFQSVALVRGYAPSSFSFPSCHAANTIAAATLTSLLFRRWRYALFIFSWAILVCWSRAYLGVHYPGDLLAGAAVGAMAGCVAYVMTSLCAHAFVRHVPWAREARQMVVTYLRGAPVITTRTGDITMKWRPSLLPVWTGITTIAFILLAAA